MRHFLILMVLAVAFGCNKKTAGIDVALHDGSKITLKVEETLRINLTTEPPTLDWQKSTDTTSGWVEMNCMEGLVEYDVTGTEPKVVPGLATKWEPLEKGKKWKFTLREGVVWNDGVPFKPQHVVDAWKRGLTKATGSEYAYFLFGVKNAKAYNEGTVKSFDDVGIKVTGANEITVELEKPMGYFPLLLTHHSTYPIRLDVIEKFGDKWTEPPNYVTLGPYNLKSWQHDKLLVMERNEKYYGNKPAIKYIAGYMIIETGTAINLFDSGKLDSVHSLPSAELKKLKKRPEFRQVGQLNLYYYGFNVEKAPMNNVKVRQAFSMAIDRKQITDMLDGGQIPMTSFVPSGMPGYEPEVGLKFDPARAKELLKEAGFADPKKLGKIQLAFNTNEDHQRIAENVQAQLRKNIGVDVEVKNEEWKVYLKNLKTDPPQLWRLGWVADYPDPDNYLGVMLSYSENNRTRWKSKKFDDMVLNAATMMDGPDRKAAYVKIQKHLTEEEVPVIPIYSAVATYLVSDRIQNYPINSFARYRYTETKIKQPVPQKN